MATRTFDINVTVGWLKGLQISENQIQAVWEAFGLPHQTELQKITPIFDAQSGHVGLVTWNESFGIQDVVVESEEVECYLEIAFWQYTDPNEEPVAIGFKRVDISDFHKNHAKVLEFQVEIDQQTQVALAHIQLSTHEKSDEASSPADAAPSTESASTTQAASEAPAETASVHHPENTQEQADTSQSRLLQQQQLQLQHAEEERRQSEEERKRLEEEAARARAQQVVQAAESERLIKLAETERQARLAAEAAVAQATEAMQHTPLTFKAVPLSLGDEVVLLNASQKAAMFRSLLAYFCGVQLPDELTQPLSQSVAITDAATPFDRVIAGIFADGEKSVQQEVQAHVQEKLMYEVLAYYVSRFTNGRDLLSGMYGEVSQSVARLLRLPAKMAAICCMDVETARANAFAAAQSRALQRAATSAGKPVYYFAASQQPLPPVPHDVLVRIVPVHGQWNDSMDEGTLSNMISEDVDAGHIPCLLSTTVGMPGRTFCDNILFLQTVCKSFGLVLHLDGPGQFLLMTHYTEASRLLEVFQDPEVAVSLAFNLQQLFAFTGTAVPFGMALLRYPGADQFAPREPIGAAQLISLYTTFRSLGLGAIRAPAVRKVQEAAYLLDSLKNCGCVEVLTDQENLFNIRFHFVAPGEGEQDPLKTNEVNSMLHQMFLKGLGSSTETLNTLTFQSSDSGLQYFEYSLLTQDIAKATTDGLCRLFQQCSRTLQSIIQYSGAMQSAVAQIETLILMPDISKAPLALACFRLIPPFYRTFDRLTESHVRDLNSINNKLIALLQQEDKAFQGVTVNSQTFVLVASDPGMTVVFSEEYVLGLVQRLKVVVSKLECDDEILSKIQAEITKRGIEVAEKQIMEAKHAEEQQESLLRLLPVVGSLANWWSPVERTHHMESLSFDLRTSTLTKQVPGRLRPVQSPDQRNSPRHPSDQ
eukprot:GGOE01014124.1.p1 GENE.GGOE01014124.1~~GGOE01014124.1.p1  ORF type:complete len:932 (+),score=207.45 GGOE01014124.1:50-2845(+)